MLHDFFKKIAPVAAIAMSIGLISCDGMNVKINDMEGVPLADLDMSGDAPTELVLAGPDKVIVSDGARLSITVAGDQAAQDALRFSLKDGTLGISRAGEKWANTGSATVNVTMPAPKSLAVAGSGEIETASLARDAEVKILGSGSARTASLDADKLDVTVAGSGTYGAAGKAKSLEVTIAGAGNAELKGLTVDDAKVTIMGSGDVDLTSDGLVKAKIMGSGNVTITGRATCKVKSMGSGTVTCQNMQEDKDESDAP